MISANRRRRIVSMRLVVTSVTVGLTTAAVVSVGALAERSARRTLTREIEMRLVLEARYLALTSAGALLSELPELTLHPLVREMQTERPELAFVVVADHRGAIQGHADARRLGTPWTPPAGLRPVGTSMRLEPGESLLGDKHLLVVQAPVTSVVGQRLGTAVVGMRRSYIGAAVASARRQQLLFLAGLLALGVALALVVMTALLRPIGALRAGLERIGRGDLDTPLRLRDRTELGLLADAVNDMAGQLKAAQRELVEKERLARELELARDIQQRLLPAGPRTAGGCVVRGAHRAAAEVGGDYYDVLPLPDGRLAITIADVSGKGLGGCLLMSMLSSLLRALKTEHGSPSALLVALEGLLGDALPQGSFITMFYGLLDPETGRLVYASAGHSPVLVYRAAESRVETFTGGGIPVGALRGGLLASTLKDSVLELRPGDVLVQYTDGVSEAFKAGGDEQFGLERVQQVVRQHGAKGCDGVIAALTQALLAWAGGDAPHDDETLLVVGRGVEAAAPAAREPVASRPGVVRGDPLVLLERAQREGCAWTVPAELERLAELHGWLDRCPHLRDLDAQGFATLESALYEACANIVEHGYRNDRSQTLEVWWLPGAAEGDGEPSGLRSWAASRVCRGLFVVRDRGFPFSPGRWQPTDFGDRNVWKQGRGFGLDIIHRTMCEVAYHPGTTAGNITLMRFDPARAREAKKEIGHV